MKSLRISKKLLMVALIFIMAVVSVYADNTPNLSTWPTSKHTGCEHTGTHMYLNGDTYTEGSDTYVVGRIFSDYYQGGYGDYYNGSENTFYANLVSGQVSQGWYYYDDGDNIYKSCSAGSEQEPETISSVTLSNVPTKYIETEETYTVVDDEGNPVGVNDITIASSENGRYTINTMVAKSVYGEVVIYIILRPNDSYEFTSDMNLTVKDLNGNELEYEPGLFSAQGQVDGFKNDTGITDVQVGDYGIILPATLSPVSTAYVNEAGIAQTNENCIPITSSMDELGEDGKTSWYVVNEDVTIEGFETYGIVNLIIADGKTLTVGDCISAEESEIFNVYGQSSGTGKINAPHLECYTGVTNICGANLNLGTDEEESAIYVEEDATLNFKGGTVIAKGSSGVFDVETEGSISFGENVKVYGSSNTDGTDATQLTNFTSENYGTYKYLKIVRTSSSSTTSISSVTLTNIPTQYILSGETCSVVDDEGNAVTANDITIAEGESGQYTIKNILAIYDDDDEVAYVYMFVRPNDNYAFEDEPTFALTDLEGANVECEAGLYTSQGQVDGIKRELGLTDVQVGDVGICWIASEEYASGATWDDVKNLIVGTYFKITNDEEEYYDEEYVFNADGTCVNSILCYDYEDDESSSESFSLIVKDGSITITEDEITLSTIHTADSTEWSDCTFTLVNGAVTLMNDGVEENYLKGTRVTGVSLGKESTTLTAGGEETLSATIAPNNATLTDVTWTSSDESVATVDSTGKVTAVSTGTATITATTLDGRKTATCTVTVSPSTPTTVSTPYVNADGVAQTNVDCIPITTSTTTLGTTGETTWYVVNEDVTITDGDVKAIGNVNIILVDGKTFTVTGEGGEAVGKAGINVSGEGNSLTIWGQANGTGTINATGGLSVADGSGGAGIGGNVNQNGNNITINGGTINATGSTFAAGIGGGYGHAGTNIIINNGSVTSTGGSDGAGIGGGRLANGTDISINGGTVVAVGNQSGAFVAAGIGGGVNATGIRIKIGSGLVVKAGATSNPTEVVPNVDPGTTDLASSLVDKPYVTIAVSPSKTTTSASDFTFTAPTTLTAGTARSANVTTSKTGMGTITVYYSSDNGSTWSSTAPSTAGTYKVAIDVAEGTSYTAGTKITADTWTFTLSTESTTEFSNYATSGLVWQLTDNNTKLTITKTGTGDGRMPDLGPGEYAPWFSYRDTITTVVIGSGVTSIGQGTFNMHINVNSITIPSSVTNIGEDAFRGCDGLTSVVLEGQLESIADYSFNGVGTEWNEQLQMYTNKEILPTLTLPSNWTGTTPDETTNEWYGGYFTYTISPSTPTHTHSWNYSVGADGKSFVATCNGIGTCTITNKKLTLGVGVKVE